MLPIAGGALTASVGSGLRFRDIRGLRACSVSELRASEHPFVSPFALRDNQLPLAEKMPGDTV